MSHAEENMPEPGAKNSEENPVSGLVPVKEAISFVVGSKKDRGREGGVGTRGALAKRTAGAAGEDEGGLEPRLASFKLSEAQCKAMEMIWGGYSLVAAAAGAGVNRTTVYRWLKQDGEFAAAYRACEQFMLESARHRMLGLCELAVTHISRAIIDGDTKAALTMLKGVGAMAREGVIGGKE